MANGKGRASLERRVEWSKWGIAFSVRIPPDRSRPHAITPDRCRLASEDGKVGDKVSHERAKCRRVAPSFLPVRSSVAAFYRAILICEPSGHPSGGRLSRTAGR